MFNTINGRSVLLDWFADCEQMVPTIYGCRANMNSLSHLIEMMSFHIIKLIWYADNGSTSFYAFLKVSSH